MMFRRSFEWLLIWSGCPTTLVSSYFTVCFLYLIIQEVFNNNSKLKCGEMSGAASNTTRYQRASTNELAMAMRNPDNFESILVCTVVFIVVGILMMVTGAIICLIYFTEITPPNFDSNYHRYVGSSMPRIVGPLLVAFGGLLSVGDIIVVGLTVQQHYKKEREQEIPRTAVKMTPA